MLVRDFKLKPSIYYLVGMWVAFFATALIILLLPIWPGVRFLLLILSCGYMGYLIWRYGLLQSEYSIVQLTNQTGKNWQILLPSASYQAELCGSSTVTRWISVLRFKIGSKRTTCIVCPDSLPSDHYRQLMMVARMH